MLLKKTTILAAAFVGSAYAGSININATDVNLGFGYKTALVHNDNKITESSGAKKASSSGEIDLKDLEMIFSGKINEKVDFEFKYDLLSSMTAWAWAQYNPNSMFSLRVGKDTLNAGGWENINWGLMQPFQSYYVQNMPLGSAGDAWEVIFHSGAGDVSLQLVDDNKTTHYNSGVNNGNHKQPAWVFEYIGTFGMISPLLQYGSYDSNHSTFYTLGAAVDTAGLMLTFDYTVDAYSYESGAKEMTDTTSAMALEASYAVGNFKPWVKMTTHDKKQDGTDAKGNAAVTVEDGTSASAASEAYVNARADNSNDLGLGVAMMNWGNGFVPYLSYITRSGKYIKTGTETETRTGTEIEVGFKGVF